ncbi:hypothetical protein SE17_26810 [Kouleothrix aurantiaca]|uniref:Uncharacterized protein n=1 Tax=Kouleothrix aurantiaca TaxID=186479 RepID=A0A0P9H8Z4_9CHLR|nr:hypothetical protein SE17_26810 [Kouleothrix aurantiaca]
MSDADYVVQEQQQLLQTHRRTLAHALVQLAMQGGYAQATPSLLNSIDEHCATIQRIKIWLRDHNTAIEDEENDLAAQRLRQLPGNDGPRRGDTPLGTRVTISRLNNSMGVLRDLMRQVPDIHDAAVEFRTIFQAACKQIDTLRSYKLLHDQLHDVQFRCYENIERELQHYPEREYSADNLATYADNLEDCIAELREIIANTPTLRTVPVWVEWLAEAHSQILQALSSENTLLLRRAADQIRRVLNVYPTPINARLISTVQSMDLGTLVDIMEYIHRTCSDVGVNAETVKRLGDGLTALRELHAKLTNLSSDHEQWQPIDNLLRLPNDSLDDIVALWDKLKLQAGELYGSSKEDWARELRDDADRIDQAVQLKDARVIKQQFISYRSRAMRRFFQVDKQLRKVCDKLDHVGGPFAFVIGVLE